MRHVAILGAGVAGSAAAWQAKTLGARVTVIDAGFGASDVTSGVVDDVPWEQRPFEPATPRALTDDESAFRDALGIWRLEGSLAMVATASGIFRPARGVDASLLDVGACRGEVLGVADVPHRGWDGPGLARALSAEAYAQRRDLKVVSVPLALLHRDDERLYPDADIAGLHDDPTRLSWLAERVVEARRQTPFDALLVGAWLGLERPCAPALSSLAGVPVGEVPSTPGGAAGVRLRAALTRLLTANQIPVTMGVAKIRTNGHGWRIEGVTDGGFPTVDVDAIVIALGGIASGGIALVRADPTRIESPPPRFTFPALDDASLAHDPPSVDGDWTASSGDPNLRWTPRSPGALERVGLTHSASRILDERGLPREGLFGAGDVLAARPRTVLEAVRAGLRAGRRAAG